MRVAFTQLGLHRIGDLLVDVKSRDEIHDVADAGNLARYTEGVHYVVVPEPSVPAPAPEPKPETDEERDAREKAEAAAAATVPQVEAPKPKAGPGAGARK